MTIDDPTAQPDETEQAAAELRELFDLIDETVDAVTDDEIEQRLRQVRSRSPRIGRDGQDRTSTVFRRWQPLSTAGRSLASSAAAEAAALEAMRAASRDHLAALEYQLMAVKAELAAAEARLELAQLREQEAVARAERAEQEAARAKTEAAEDAAASADAFVDAALERSQEITDRAHRQAEEILAAAQHRAADLLTAAEERARRHQPVPPATPQIPGGGRHIVVAMMHEGDLAEHRWAHRAEAADTADSWMDGDVMVACHGRLDALAWQPPPRYEQRAVPGTVPVVEAGQHRSWAPAAESRTAVPGAGGQRWSALLRRVRRALSTGAGEQDEPDDAATRAAEALPGDVPKLWTVRTRYTLQPDTGQPTWSAAGVGPTDGRWGPLLVFTVKRERERETEAIDRVTAVSD